MNSSRTAAQLLQLGQLKRRQACNNSTLGSWVLVNATTGEQMTNPLTGHSDQWFVKDQYAEGGELGKQASSFGGMYVLESLADKEGNVAEFALEEDVNLMLIL